MRDPSAGFALSMTTFGGKRLGPGTALVDEDVLRVLLLDAPDGEKAMQIRYEAIVGVGLSDGSVVVTVRDGRSFIVATGETSAFRQGVLAACRSLPEVTRALRALGSRRGTGGARRNPGDGEARFFAPFIAARRSSMDARDASGVIAAFDARRLAQELARTIVAFAAEQGGGNAARQRAFEAELSDAVEQLDASLEALEKLAARARSDVDELGSWREWAAGVQNVFETADRAWVSIEPMMGRR